jgi:nicotinamidase-related amidase
MKHMLKVTGTASLLVIVDVQEKLLPVIHAAESLLSSIRFLMDAAATLEVPVLLTEQYPRGLGSTVPELTAHPAVSDRTEKLRFSAAGEIGEWLGKRPVEPPDTVILAGIESHVCVLQSALELTDRGFKVLVVADACGSRFPSDHEIALRALSASGIRLTSAESIAFEWCEIAGTDRFRTLSRLVRERRR